MTPIITSLGLHDVALLIARETLGVFFLLARFRWVYDPSRASRWFNCGRHISLARKLAYCGYSERRDLAAAVAVVEIAAGLALIVGLLTNLAAFGLLVVLIGATICTAREKTMRQSPVDRVDVVSCYLWTVEPVYITLAVLIVLMGPGAYSLDALLLTLL